MPKFKNAVLASEMTDGGIVKGYASTFDREPDAYGDIIAPGAFADSLKRWAESGKPIPLLYGHNTADPEYNIGKLTLAKEDERGLYVEAEFDPDNPKAQYTRKLAQEGRLYQFSFAYDVLDAAEVEIDGRKAFELRKIDLFEVSLVQIPANQHAEVTDVKSQKSGRRNSKADEKTLKDLRKHLSDALTLLDSLDISGDAGEDDSESEGGEDNAKSEGREDEKKKLAMYKEIMKDML
ncbi:MAG: HK97 family phage prohead protease [Coriobacteriales bacterium]|nr:HK97 family phage prohead protease [Coriobacteriales bacterium]